jgi:hypothetical protein
MMHMMTQRKSSRPSHARHAPSRRLSITTTALNTMSMMKQQHRTISMMTQ